MRYVSVFSEFRQTKTAIGAAKKQNRNKKPVSIQADAVVSAIRALLFLWLLLADFLCQLHDFECVLLLLRHLAISQIDYYCFLVLI